MSEYVMQAYFFALGAIFGSFANVLILRLPKNETLLTRSHCNACGSMVAWYDNIPILTWFILRGKCRKCKAAFSFRYPLVEILSAVLFWYCYYQFGLSIQLVEMLLFTYGLLVVTFIDFDHMILPDEFTLSGIVIGLIGSVLNPDRAFLDSLLGVLLGGGVLWLVAYLYWVIRKEEGMGGGDIKLLAWIGAVLGYQSIPFVILCSSIVGSVVGLTIAFRSKGNFQTAIPYGPYLVLGAIGYALLGGREFSQWYWEVFSLGSAN